MFVIFLVGVILTVVVGIFVRACFKVAHEPAAEKVHWVQVGEFYRQPKAQEPATPEIGIPLEFFEVGTPSKVAQEKIA